jgi:two-component system cell cycle sensor histidine kinase PleC
MLFVVTDFVRTAGETGDELQIVEAVMSEIGIGQITPAALTNLPIAAKPRTLELIDSEALGGVIQRGTGAFLMALLMIAISWRQREPARPVAESGSEFELEIALASVQEQQRMLARQYHEEKLSAEAANHAKVAFLAHLSHDIRTPLNHIIGFAELMRHETYGPLGDARYGNYVDTIKGSGERLLSFFASILELAEFESGQKSLRQDPLLTDELLRTVVRRYRPQAMRAGLIINSGHPTDSTLVGDRFGLERMLGNLIDNAIRFTPQGGRVTVSAYAADNGVVLEITDTGIGMSAERLSAVSQPFAMAFGDAALTREHGGAGLGISIARAIAEQSGGHLVIDSRPGLGTTVAISLPLHAAIPDSEAA